MSFRFTFLVILALLFVLACGGEDAVPESSPSSVPKPAPSSVRSEEVVSFEGGWPSDPVLSVEIAEVEEAAVPDTEGVVTVPDEGEVPLESEVGDLPQVTVEEILERLAGTVDSFDSGSYELSVLTDVEGEGLSMAVGLTISGDYQGLDRQRLDVKMDVGFFAIETEMVIIGDSVYVKDPASGDWMLDDGDVSLAGGFHEMVEALRAVNAGAHLVLSGRVVEGDQEFYVLEGDIPPEFFEAVLGEDVEGILSLSMVYRIGVDDGLFYGLEMVAEEEGGARSVTKLRFFDYGKEVVIEAPVLSSGWKDFAPLPGGSG